MLGNLSENQLAILSELGKLSPDLEFKYLLPLSKRILQEWQPRVANTPLNQVLGFGCKLDKWLQTNGPGFNATGSNWNDILRRAEYKDIVEWMES